MLGFGLASPFPMGKFGLFNVPFSSMYSLHLWSSHECMLMYAPYPPHCNIIFQHKSAHETDSIDYVFI